MLHTPIYSNSNYLTDRTLEDIRENQSFLETNVCDGDSLITS